MGLQRYTHEDNLIRSRLKRESDRSKKKKFKKIGDVNWSQD